MVSNDRVTVHLELDTAQAETELQRLERAADAVMTKAQRTIQFVKTNMSKIARTIDVMVDVFANALRAAGIEIGAVGQALIGSIGVVLQSIIHMQAMLAAGTGGLSLAFGAVMIATAVTTSAMAIYYAQAGIKGVQDEINAAVASVRGLSRLTTIW